jgi:hypothetical protein
MRRNNPGKRERLAGKRHRRGMIVSGFGMPPGSAPLKVGSRHFGRWIRRSQSVAENENLG